MLNETVLLIHAVRRTAIPIYTSPKHFAWHYNLHVLPVTTADYAPLLNTVHFYKNSSHPQRERGSPKIK